MKAVTVFLAVLLIISGASAQPSSWQREFPLTDWQTRSIDFDEILSGGPPRDGIPSIDAPSFLPVAEIDTLGREEPVMSVVINGDARAYPLRVLTWHEIVNDTVGGVPVAITYCPLCNSGIVFERTVDDQVLDFGTTGRLRNSDLVMYDRQTETWWQQFLGEGIIGAQTGVRLTMVPARLESWQLFADRHPDGQVLVPTQSSGRAYGRNPYVGYDSSARPFLYRGDYDGPGAPLSRVVAVGDQAWLLSLLRDEGMIEAGDLVLTWSEGQNSALDSSRIDQGRDVGNVTVQRRQADGSLADVAYDVPFAFAFAAFYPDATIHDSVD